jgi:pyruvate dehydrogenase E1 component
MVSIMTALWFSHLRAEDRVSVKPHAAVDFSTGSVGIGATSTIWSALSHRYVSDHFDVPRGGRHIALVGDAELDEGAIWKALVDPMVPRLGEVVWVIDINRQSLDRVVPDIAAGRIAQMFDAAGWDTLTVKYGRRLRELFTWPGGEGLRRRIDEMSNEEYQRLLVAGPTAADELEAGGVPVDVLCLTSPALVFRAL